MVKESLGTFFILASLIATFLEGSLSGNHGSKRFKLHEGFRWTSFVTRIFICVDGQILFIKNSSIIVLIINWLVNVTSQYVLYTTLSFYGQNLFLVHTATRSPSAHHNDILRQLEFPICWCPVSER